MAISDIHGKRFLVVGAHPDDIELGCGATIAHYAGTCEIFCAVLSRNDEFPPRGPELAGQAVASLTSLGVPRANVRVAGFRARYFRTDRQDIADYLARLCEEITPDLLITHSTHDLHQDHTVVHDEARRVFRHDILAFEIIPSSFGFQPVLYIPVSEAEAVRKIESLNPYLPLHQREFLTEDIQRSHLRLRGFACNSTYAEAFELFSLVVDTGAGTIR